MSELVEQLRLLSSGLTPRVESELMLQAADEIERLGAALLKALHERDGPRRGVCSIAYPEQHIQELVKVINALRAERDEARDRNVRLLSQLQEYEAREQ